MKIFLGVLLAATIIGGFVGAEIFDVAFSITGAVIGGVGTAAVLLGLGAYFDAQDRKSKKLPPEMIGVFDRMITGKENPTQRDIQAAKKAYLSAAKSRQTKEGKAEPFSTNKLQATFIPSGSQQAKQAAPSSKMLRDAGLPPVLADSISSLMVQDAEAIARGEIPETRLIPHHAIKRDIIIAAYTKDFEESKNQVRNMAGQDYQKADRIRTMADDFEKHIYGIKRLRLEELDKIIALMEETRTDSKEIEQDIRLKKPIYKIVDPIFG